VAESDIEDILKLQNAYAAAVVEQGNLPREIAAKHRKYMKLQELRAKGQSNAAEAKELIELAIGLLPHLHFKIDDVNWRKQ
jgi:hypothetical protein